MVTCDYADDEIEENIAHNFRLNDIDPPPHIPVLCTRVLHYLDVPLMCRMRMTIRVAAHMGFWL